MACEGWKKVEFAQIAHLRKEKFDPSGRSDSFPCIELEHIQKETGRVLGHINSDKQESTKNRFYPGDVLFGKLRPNLRKYATVDHEGVCSSEIWVFKPTGEVIQEYLFNIIQTESFIQAACVTAGSKMPRADWNYVSEIPFLVPPKDEQKKIADRLKVWYQAIEKTERLIEAKRSRHVALANKLLSKKSSAVPLKKILKLTLRDVAKPDKPYWALGIRSHGKGTFRRFVEKPEAVAMDTLYRVRHDDLIVNITFAWEGAIAFVDKADEDCLVSHRFPTFEIDINKALPAYLRHVIVQKRFVQNLGLVSPGGAGRNRVLNKTDFLNLKISLPEIKEQEKIGDVLNTSLREISLLEAKLELLKKQKRGLMQKLLTGEWRVKVE
jgi:type I restriction enzyme S subunit